VSRLTTSPYDEATLTQLGRAFDEQWPGWSEDLPGVVADVSKDLDITPRRILGVPHNALILMCSRKDEENCILKLSPDRTALRLEAAALDAWSENPHVVALEFAGSNYLLLEYVGMGRSAQDAQNPVDSIADVFIGIHASEIESIDADFPDLDDRLERAFNATSAKLSGPRSSRRLHRFDGARDLAASRDAAGSLAKSGDRVLLHGDLHAGNCLHSGAHEAYVAVDPMPCIGDPHFDAIDAALLNIQSERELRDRVHDLSRRCAKIDADRLWAWCQVSAYLIGVNELAKESASQATQFKLNFGLKAGSPS
jgi:streptomycin 6-kinase